MNHDNCRDEHGHLMFDHGSGICSKCMIVLLDEELEDIKREAAAEMRQQRDDLAAEVRQLLLSIDCYAKHNGYARGVQVLKTTQASRETLKRIEGAQ